MKIVVASGKGGTGKTLVATSLFLHWARQGKDPTYVDADVEEPNGHLFLAPEIDGAERFSVPVPVLEGKCDGCGRCGKACAFSAIVPLKDRVMIFPAFCHSCGACITACPKGSLRVSRREIGSVRWGKAAGARFLDGTLDVGEARAARLVEGVVDFAKRDRILVDAPPGTACPAVAAVKGADLALLVTEPTPFGRHDLDLALKLCRALGVPPLVIMNRCDLAGGLDSADPPVDAPVIARLPFDPQIATATAMGMPAIDAAPALALAVAEIAAVLERAVPGELP